MSHLETIGDPRDFGAVYDGVKDCSSAINKCIKKYDHIIFRGTGTALVKSPILVRTGSWLDMDPGFTIKLADDVNDLLLKNRWSESAYFAGKNGNPDFMSELYPGFTPDEWELGETDRNIKITGGIFDGNGKHQTRQDWRYGSMGYYGTVLMFVNVEGLEMSNVKIRNALTYNAEFHITKNFRLNNINLDYDEPRPNLDGLHFGGDCYNGIIDGVTGKTYDDMVALNGGDCWYPKPSKDGVILPQANKVWFPFAQGRIANIEIRSIMAQNGYRAIRLLSNTRTDESPENETEGMDNILIDGIYGSYCVNSVLISSFIGKTKNYDNITIRNIKNSLFDGGRMANIYAEPSTFVNNLIISDYYYKAELQEPVKLSGSIGKFTLRDAFIEVSDNTDMKGRTAITISRAKYITFDNVTVSDEYLHIFSLNDSNKEVRINISNSNFV